MPDVKVSVVATKGSAPRDQGAWMRVETVGLVSGTIGGGALEFEAIRRAQCFDGKPYERSFPLGPSIGQCCGGNVTLRFEAWAESQEQAPQLQSVVLFGSGHVGQALSAALAALPFTVSQFDPRSNYPGENAWNFDALAVNSFVLILTHSHRLDLDLCAEALRRPFPFIGLIGSTTKRAKFESRLRTVGLDPSQLVCPIGLATIGGKEPAVIAASVAAQLLIERQKWVSR